MIDTISFLLAVLLHHLLLHSRLFRNHSVFQGLPWRNFLIKPELCCIDEARCEGWLASLLVPFDSYFMITVYRLLFANDFLEELVFLVDAVALSGIANALSIYLRKVNEKITHAAVDR